MEAVITSFAASLAQQGPLFVALAIAIYYLKQSDEKKAEVNAELIQAMNKERVERIGILENHVDECNERHADTQKKYEELLRRVAKIDRDLA
jgi:septal ring factor EnvC (AmiA/AmiB activator)